VTGDATQESVGRNPWDEQAANWLRWTRTPGHDVFPRYAPQFFDQVVPSPRGLTLEAGCGEGRVARELAARGHRVVALDVSPALLRHARDADRTPSYVAGDAAALPFAGASFDTVVAYNVLQAIPAPSGMAAAVREAGRVLCAGGRLCVCVAHPMTDVGVFRGVSEEGDLRFTGSYFERRQVRETVVKDGLEMTFHGRTHTLEDYVRAIEAAGLVVERLREPLPAGDPAGAGGIPWDRVPLFLFLRAAKRA
jgi:SAM-dependent methyltransferase